MGTRGRPRHPDVLTPAEWQVVHAVRHGMSNREIARRRGVEFENAPHLIHKHDNGVEEWMAFFPDPDGHLLAIMAQVF